MCLTRRQSACCGGCAVVSVHAPAAANSSRGSPPAPSCGQPLGPRRWTPRSIDRNAAHRGSGQADGGRRHGWWGFATRPPRPAPPAAARGSQCTPVLIRVAIITADGAPAGWPRAAAAAGRRPAAAAAGHLRRALAAAASRPAAAPGRRALSVRADGGNGSTADGKFDYDLFCIGAGSGGVRASRVAAGTYGGCCDPAGCDTASARTCTAATARLWGVAWHCSLLRGAWNQPVRESAQ